ncbi:MAG: SUMF1/EgtB/PvdO family nonheme iron enzyme [Bryobacterales bacterium]|nr:SUMF1/EgtB/PvdO family nonheme iron enzyme [Bryobacterales bacterium]
MRLQTRIRIARDWVVCWMPLLAINGICQPGAEIAIATYAGLTLTGAPGTVYSIERLDELGATGGGQQQWQCVEMFQLATSPSLWVDKMSAGVRQRYYRAIQFAPRTNMVFVPPGTFLMGSPTDEMGRLEAEGPVTSVTISRGFWVVAEEVTQAEYETIVRMNRVRFRMIRIARWRP